MKKIKKISQELFNNAKSNNKITAGIVIVLITLIGTYLLLGSQAATPYVTITATSGSLAGGAIAQSCVGASGSNCVVFNGATGNITATCPSPTPVAPVTGYAIVKCEDFNNGLGAFSAYDGGGGSTVIGVGRIPSQCTVSNGILALKQASNGATCGGWMTGFGQQYGYWEVKMRAYSTDTSSGSAPHPVLILWPSTGGWTSELDYFETNIGSPASGYLHCTGSNVANNCLVLPTSAVDYSQWHVYGIKWTSNSMAGYIDGTQWWSSSNTSSFQPLGPSNQTIQLDNLSSTLPVKPGEMDIDWVHMYK